MLLKDDQPTGLQGVGQPAGGLDGIGLNHEHPPPDGTVELTVLGRERAEITLREGDYREVELTCSLCDAQRSVARLTSGQQKR